MTNARTIRDAGAADLPALAALERESFSEPWSVAELASWVELPERALVLALEDQAGIAAYALFLLLPGEEAELLRVAVGARARRQGLAARLLTEAFALLAAGGRGVCLLEVRPGNEAAIALYRRLGFVASGLRRGYYSDGSDALIFRRESAPAGG
ncbi:MAG: GNAT family N-acetyltransferase [Thermoanaerobaculia bacterium]